MRAITRARLKQYIETGIKKAPELSNDEIVLLRAVGDTADTVSTGASYDPDTGCYCPLAQAGLWADFDSTPGNGRRAFYTAFDSCFTRERGEWIMSLEVVG